MYKIQKSDLDIVDINEFDKAFDLVKSKAKNPEEKLKRDIIYFIKKYSRKYQLNIENILNFKSFINTIEEKTQDFYELGIINEIKKKKKEIKELKHKQEKILKINQRRFHEIINSTSQWFWIIDKNLNLIDINLSLCKMLGYEKEELLWKNIRDLFDTKNKKILNKQVKNIDKTTHREYHIDLTKKDWWLLPIVLKATSLYDDNWVFREAIAFITDITEIREYEQKLYNISIKDELTWIWNRRLFDNLLKKHFDEIVSKNSNIKNLWICLFDIDFFKRINDGLWHDIWDIVLKELWQRLIQISKGNIEVFRVWWEEFWVLGTNVEKEIFYKIIEDFRKYNEENPIIYPDWKVSFTISWWIVFFDETKTKIKTPQELYKKADLFLYAAKNSWKNNIKTPEDI